MANINKLKISGTTYNIQDENATKTVELTQAQYDALAVKDPNTFYIITDATAGDLSNYYTKTETSGATEISTALASKQDTLISGTNIKTINNESLLGSGNIDIQGGATYTAGRGININPYYNTINLDVPVYKASNSSSAYIGMNQNYPNNVTGEYSFAVGLNNLVSGKYSMVVGGLDSYGEGNSATTTNAYAFGRKNLAKSFCSFLNGYGNISSNYYEYASGSFNNSVSASTTFGDSGNTLFSVGNGTADNARHNAFEIRQNGDIYLTLDGQDVKLQDQLGGSSIIVDTALDSGSTNPVENRVIYNKIDEIEEVTAAGLNALNDRISEDEEVTAAGLNAVNDKFDGLKLKKLTQAEYDALSPNYDSNTLYIVI